MNEEEIVKKLINTYPNSISVTIEYNRWPKLDFVETVDNFAENIMNDFDSKENCARYLATYMHSINELCQEWIDDNYYVVDGELYYDGEEED